MELEHVLKQADIEQDEGMKALRAGNYEKAAEFLSKSLEKRVGLYGELAPECAYSYFKYGSALLYKSQEEAEVLGGKAAAAAEAAEAGAAGSSGVGKPGGASSKGITIAEKPVDRKGKGPAQEVDEDEEEADEEDGGADEVDLEEDAEGGEEADETDLALAWQILETARCIYERMPNRSLDEVDVIMNLADISAEKEEFDACVEDYQRAISLLHALLPPHHRRVAEAYFRLCLVQQTAQKPADALAACRKALESCRLCVDHLKAQISSPQGSPTEVATANGDASSAELQAVPKAEASGEGATVAAAAEGSTSKAGGEKTEGEGQKEASAKEDLEKELAEVEAVISDLKEKEAELDEMLSQPSLKHMMTNMMQQMFGLEGSAPGASAGAGPSNAAGTSASAATVAAASNSGPKQEVAPTSSKVAVLAEATNSRVDATTAVVGRGKKRVAPMPVDAAAASSIKRLA